MTWTRYQANNRGTGCPTGGGETSGNMVYLAACNAIYAFDLDSGIEVWHTAGTTIQWFGGKALSTDGHTLYAYGTSKVHAVSTSNGTVAWSAGMSGTTEAGVSLDYVAGSPKVYVGDGNGRLYAFDGSGNSLWINATDFGAFTQSPTVMNDHNLVVATADGAVKKVSYADGTVLISSAIATSPHYSHVVLDSGGNIFAVGNTKLYSYDSSCTLRWAVDSDYETTPAIASDGKIYQGRGTVFECLNNDSGIAIWTTNDVPTDNASPALSPDEQHVYTPTQTSGLVCMNTADGSVDWIGGNESGSWQSYIAAPAIDNSGFIYSVHEYGAAKGFWKIAPDGSTVWVNSITCGVYLSEDVPSIDGLPSSPAPTPSAGFRVYLRSNFHT